MDVKIYTHHSSVFEQVQVIVHKYFEYFLLLFIALIGLVCSAFALVENCNHSHGSHTRKVIGLVGQSNTGVDQFMKIEGSFQAKEPMLINLSLYLNAHRYVLDMGDGRRVIVTQPSFEYSYPQKGEYTIVLKEIKRGLITPLGEKKIEIK